MCKVWPGEDPAALLESLGCADLEQPVPHHCLFRHYLNRLPDSHNNTCLPELQFANEAIGGTCVEIP